MIYSRDGRMSVHVQVQNHICRYVASNHTHRSGDQLTHTHTTQKENHMHRLAGRDRRRRRPGQEGARGDDVARVAFGRNLPAHRTRGRRGGITLGKLVLARRAARTCDTERGHDSRAAAAHAQRDDDGYSRTGTAGPEWVSLSDSDSASDSLPCSEIPRGHTTVGHRVRGSCC